MSIFRSLLVCVCLGVGTLVIVGSSTAASPPEIQRVSPLRLRIGDTLTIQGKGFIPGRNRNWVVFQRPRARVVFVRVDNATKTRMTLIVPAKLLAFLAHHGQSALATRFSLRVLARRLGPVTRRSQSPIIGPSEGRAPATTSGADCVNGVPTGRSVDSDHDGLSDSLEKKIGTDPCKADTDGDGVPDGYEYMAALDLNSQARPYPGKRPYPNPLDPTDANIDHDGDGLTMMDEYQAWVRYDGKFPLTSYSDGTQNTGGPQPIPPGKGYLDLNGNGTLSDDERDVDGDGLGNWVEAHGPLSGQDYWSYIYKDEKPYPVKFAGTDWLDPDTNGDGVPDGLDDQDHDGYNNIQESSRSVNWVNPFNPCLPDPRSPTCSLHPPLSEQSYPPFGTAASGFVPADGNPPAAPLTCTASPVRCKNG